MHHVSFKDKYQRNKLLKDVIIAFKKTRSVLWFVYEL